MPVLSVFQCLPLHISKSIARYYKNTSIDDGHPTLKDHEISMRMWDVFYDVSYLWQLLALKFFFQDATIELGQTDKSKILNYKYLPDRRKSLSTYPIFTRRVTIKPYKLFLCKFSCSVLHPPSDCLSIIWPEDMVFPSAQALSVDVSFEQYREDTEYNGVDDEPFKSIAGRILTSMRKLQAVYINGGLLSHAFNLVCEFQLWKASEVLSAFVTKASGFNFYMDDVSLAMSQHLVSVLAGFTNLKFTVDDKAEILYCLVQKSTHTLEHLVVYDSCHYNLKSLFFDEANEPIVYPRLRILEVKDGWFYDHDEVILLDSSIVPFPVLKWIVWKARYIFGDDTLFRGNSATLEHVDIIMDEQLVRVLQKHKVSANGSYRKLTHLELDVRYSQVSMPQLSRVDYLECATTILTSATQRVRLGHTFPREWNFPTVLWDTWRETLQCLELGVRRVAFPDAVKFIMCLPNLQRLQFRPVTTEDSFCSLDDSDAIEEIYDYHYPLSRNFRCWDIEGRVHPGCLETVIKMYFVLTILCPKFSAAGVSRQLRKYYKRELDAAKSGKRHWQFQECLLADSQ